MLGVYTNFVLLKIQGFHPGIFPCSFRQGSTLACYLVYDSKLKSLALGKFYLLHKIPIVSYLTGLTFIQPIMWPALCYLLPCQSQEFPQQAVSSH